MHEASPELESFIDEMIYRSREKGYIPTVFMRMRRENGTIRSISKLVRSGDLQSGFARLRDLGLLNWTIEAAVVKFSVEFDRDDIECAKFRLAEAKKG